MTNTVKENVQILSFDLAEVKAQHLNFIEKIEQLLADANDAFEINALQIAKARIATARFNIKAELRTKRGK
jgi:hypothetical protein